MKYIKTADISDCELYRWRLIRDWAEVVPQCLSFEKSRTVNFIMLNPSTADGKTDDPTIRRCVSYAKLWGYTKLIVTNLYAFRATSPKDMKSSDDPIGSENIKHICDNALQSDMVICAWGNNAELDYAKTVLKYINHFNDNIKALRITKAGQPAHPLYLPKDIEPIAFSLDN